MTFSIRGALLNNSLGNAQVYMAYQGYSLSAQITRSLRNEFKFLLAELRIPLKQFPHIQIRTHDHQRHAQHDHQSHAQHDHQRHVPIVTT